MTRTVRTLIGVALTFTAASCSVGPDYRHPALPMATGYKSVSTQPSTRPTAAAVRQDWWLLFNDETLTRLEEQCLYANYELQGAMARVEQARASAGVVKAGFFPTVAVDPSFTRSFTGGGTNRSSSLGSVALNGGRTATSVVLPIDLSYELDLWGRVRRQFEAAKARTQAAINDFGLVRLTLTTDLAVSYFNLRSLDAQDEIAGRNIELYKKQLDFLSSQTKAGFAAPLDVVQVKTLLESTEATQYDLRRQRRNQEHAIAILLGRPPSEVDLATAPLTPSLPDLPAGLPADLLRQRPDLAEAEQQLVATNAEVGVAIADFLPTLSIGASLGYRSDAARGTIDAANRFASIGPSAVIPLFDAALGPNLNLARAAYAEQLASYRNSLLGAFRDVEDALTNIDLQARQAEAQDRAVADAREYVRLAEIQNRQGIITPLQVLDADRTLLSNELTAAQILNQRMASVVLLVRAVGGGWDATLPPSTQPTTRPASQRLSD